MRNKILCYEPQKNKKKWVSKKWNIELAENEILS